MDAKEKSKRTPKRLDEDLNDSIECANCGDQIKPEDYSDDLICNCLVLVFCSSDCKERSDHFKTCNFINDFGRGVPSSLEDLQKHLNTALAVKSKLRGDLWERLVPIEYFSFLLELKETITKVTENRSSNIVWVSGLGGLVASRCSNHLKDIVHDTPGVGLSEGELGFEELLIIRKELKKSVLISTYLGDLDQFSGSCFEPMDEQTMFRVRFDENSQFDQELAMNDLKKIAQGPEEIDTKDHAHILCSHFFNQRFSTDICRSCFKQGYERARAVASGAIMFSSRPSEHIDHDVEFYSVLFEVETETENPGPAELEMKRESFYLYRNKRQILTVLRYLSLHSVDVDPRMICMNPDLYWTIIWYFGSITKALKEAGGQRLYDIGFDTPRGWSIKGALGSIMTVLWSIMGFNEPQTKLPTSKIKNHFVSKFTNKKMELRYCCSNPSCLKLEDTEKFLGCAECSKDSKRRYCSKECQVKDWEEHKRHCKGQKDMDSSNQTLDNSEAGAWKKTQQRSRKGKGKKKKF